MTAEALRIIERANVLRHEAYARGDAELHRQADFEIDALIFVARIRAAADRATEEIARRRREAK
jgi:hypothetical protein